MKLAFKASLAGAVLASTAVLAAPGTASADEPVTRCETGEICLYDGHNLTGSNLQLKYGVDTPDIGWAWNDRASSVWNRGEGFVCIYTDADYRGHHYSIPPGEKQELRFLYDNAVSSLEYGGCGG
ncbi:peptidase inhibitor family I36 protein [Streptomyces olivaceus]|uniref:peptidase inhibitor family I36 protein n=1 Tax=Streptomyces olivaceus TaxID=47716 RepID=UPI001CCA4EAC|nr:peptidase inhibitor family I36 protein [Streptomyces olivaceus]MBZ6085793.1 peptidase inhibitor family I36 protein [Streptomyces olivaceus]